MASNNQDLNDQKERTRIIEVSDSVFEHDGVRFVTVYSPALRGRGDISVLASPGIELLTSVPIVLLLHGVYGSHWAWFFKGGAHRTALDLVATGRTRPMLLVAPSDGLYGDGSGYLCHSGADYERWIVQDVLETIFKVFSCADRNSSVFITGLSMGGYGALRLGTKYTGVFRGISAHSAITRIEEMSSFIFDPFPGEQVIPEEMDILHWCDKNRGTLPPMRFDCGVDDPLIEGNRCLHNKLQQRAIDHQYLEFEGNHSWEYWHTQVASTLIFFEEIMRNAITGQS
jgi:S-formylglutathione hydrolase FrmB